MRGSGAVFVLLLAQALAACDPAREAPAEQAEAVSEEPMSSEAAPAFVGTWAADSAQCALPQESDVAPYIFTADGFDQHEAHCTFSNVIPLGEGEWRVGAQCIVEGDDQRTAFDLTLDGDALRIADGEPLMRCP
jgi:hypothetical protein